MGRNLFHSPYIELYRKVELHRNVTKQSLGEECNALDMTSLCRDLSLTCTGGRG